MYSLSVAVVTRFPETLTGGGVGVGEAEVIHSIEGQQVGEELFLLVLTAEEGIALVQGLQQLGVPQEGCEVF